MPRWARRATAGFVPVSVGPRILRAETAAMVAVALAQAAAGGLD
jgi:16S rRNA U1498 N3-methylase RsmE